MRSPGIRLDSGAFSTLAGHRKPFASSLRRSKMRQTNRPVEYRNDKGHRHQSATIMAMRGTLCILSTISANRGDTIRTCDFLLPKNVKPVFSLIPSDHWEIRSTSETRLILQYFRSLSIVMIPTFRGTIQRGKSTKIGGDFGGKAGGRLHVQIHSSHRPGFMAI